MLGFPPQWERRLWPMALDSEQSHIFRYEQFENYRSKRQREVQA